MAHLEVVKSKPVRFPVEHSVKVRVDLGHHEIKLPGRARGEGSEFGRCAVGGSAGGAGRGAARAAARCPPLVTEIDADLYTMLNRNTHRLRLYDFQVCHMT